MPVVRSRSGLRTEAGRGYPRLKWSDINKSTIIANTLLCDKQKEEFDVLSHAPNPSRFNGCERRAEAKKHSSPEWNQRRHGVLIQSDGESDENSSDNSLICSNLRVSPDNGKVRIALTVPLNRLASPQNRYQSVVQSTLRIKHTTLHTSKASKEVEQHYLNSSICTAGRCSSRNVKRNIETKEGCYFEANVNKLDYCSDENRRKNKSHTYIPDMSSLPFGFRDSNLFLCENKESIRPPSFWHDVKACKMGCLASQNRLRDGTFIISPSTSDSHLDQRRRGLKKLPRNSLYPAEEDYLSEGLARPLPVCFGLRTLPPLCTKVEKYSKNSDVGRSTSDSTPLEGQRVSSGDASSFPKRPSNSQTNSASPSRTGTPNHSPTVHAAGNKAVRGKKSLKTSLVEIPSRKTFQNKSKYSNSLVSNSPASLHERVLQKTATVSPAPHKAAENSPSTLTRFGFKGAPLITSGESTDSVNSILSDAQTTSDANSNIFDFGDKNRNNFKDLESKSITHHSIVHSSSTLNVRSASPCTISQASSGVTSSVLNGKIKAQTKQLPSPQTVTVKEMNKNSKKPTVQNGSLKSRYSSPITRKNSSPQPTPSVMPKDHRSKIPQNVTKSSLPRVQRPSKDIESSNRSLSTIDSGLGSSLESDKLRSPKLSSLRGKGKVLDTGQESPDTKENELHLDLSDEWLKGKHSEQEARRDFNRKSKVFEDSLNQNIPKNTPKFPKDSFKDKRDSNITYGMARQKFAPYSRYRFTYQNTTNKSSSTEKNMIKEFSKTNVSGGVVRSRIAQIEKTPLTKTATSCPSRILPKKPVARPTSIEKTPILVSLKTENTIELSRSICRRLEYSEGKSSLLEATKDKTESYLIEVPTTAQDLLMVDSYEVKRDIEEKSEHLESVADTNKMSVSLPDEKSMKIENETSEEKRIKDISECENTTKRFSAEVINDAQNHINIGLLHLPLESTTKVLSPDSSKATDGSKVFSPDGSETSFEVLESGSVDISPREESEITSKSDGYLTQLVASLANSSFHVSSDFNSSGLINSCGLANSSENIKSSELVNYSSECAGAKHSQSSPLRTLPIKKCKQDSNNEEECNCEEPLNSAQNDIQDHFIGGPRSVMESSTESNPSESNRMSDSYGDRWTVSGKCTPSVGSTRGDAEQDFLIDDEISDQPGLTFGDDLDASLFGDEDLFSDLSSPSATHILSKTERSRHGSMGTASSLGPDDLMLDYDPEDSKQYGNSKKGDSPKKPLKITEKNASLTDGKSFDVLIPGPRYEEEVLSPVACDILSEWSAILSGTAQSFSPQRSPEPCVSQQTGVVSTACSNSLGAGLSTSPTQTTSVTTHQPLTTESPTLSRTGSLRTRTCSVGPDFASSEYKRNLNLKPPRQGISSEHDGGLNIDRTTLHYICQDVTTMKTLLHRLRRVLQVTDTINPFDANLKTSLYLNLGVAESTDKEDPNSVHEVVQQNVDLKRQVILLQQRLEEKDRTIRSLQQQLTQSMSMQKSTTSSVQTLTNSSYLASPDDEHSSSSRSLSNAATQTERSSHRSSPFSLASMSRTSSVEDGLGPTVSFENAITSNVINEITTAPLDELLENVETVSSPKKKFSAEYPGVSNQPKLSLVPLTPAVEGSLAS